LSVPVVAVNLSARQFRQRRLDETIGGIVTAHNIDPRLLEFELTESMLMSDADLAIETLQRIKARGFKLVLDDFGTGHSSLRYLKRVPLDALKIDRAFVRDVTANPNEVNIAVAMINLARSLRLRVIAEGVETREQLGFLRRHGCDEVQGYHVARPMPVDVMSEILRDGRKWSSRDSGIPSKQVAGLRA
jgi:EAL domain-containing protein (putative c-di-GMP-specific phosphodiesterase class I)